MKCCMRTPTGRFSMMCYGSGLGDLLPSLVPVCPWPSGIRASWREAQSAGAAGQEYGPIGHHNCSITISALMSIHMAARSARAIQQPLTPLPAFLLHTSILQRPLRAGSTSSSSSASTTATAGASQTATSSWRTLCFR